MRRYQPSWALLVVAAGLLTAAATVFRTVEIDNEAAWLLLGMALTLIAQWVVIEIYAVMIERRFGQKSRKSEDVEGYL